MKKRIILVLTLIFSIFAVAVISNANTVNAATTYYDKISDTETGATLKQSLRTLVTTTHTNKTSYDDCKDPSIVAKTDGNEDSSQIVLFWSDIEVDVAWDSGKTWNREHVWPQSQGWFETSGAGADLHHIRPSDPSVNSSHNNNPYGIVEEDAYCTTSATNGSIKTDAKCKNGYFEPSDNKKGDTARIIFYLLVRYSESDSYSITSVAESMEMLLEWNELDPVDASEERRNDAVQKIQGNRNPFIDNSEYADLIWSGENADDTNNPGSGTTTPSTPSNGAVATFELGTDDSSKDDTKDSSSALTKYSETNNNYTLTLSNLSKVYNGYDASGHGCLKLGTSSVVGSFKFNVPEEIDKVEILVAGYKLKTATINVNGTIQNITTYSANSEYTTVTVDTKETKTISFTTTSQGYRCKINSIIYYDLDTVSTTPTVTEVLESIENLKTSSSLMVSYCCEQGENSLNQGSYSYTFTESKITGDGTKELNQIKWVFEHTLKNTSSVDYYSYNSTKGQQFGSANNPYEQVVLTTVESVANVTEVSIYASGASSINAQLTAYVGDEIIGTTKVLTSTNQLYTFTSLTGMSGKVKFVITQESSKAIYIKGLGFEYGDLSNSYEEYSLNYAGIRFGSFVTKEVYDLLNNDETKWGVEYASGDAENLESVSVKTVYCSPAKVTSFNSTETSENGNYYQWSVLIEGLNYFHIDSAISARMFVEYEGVRYYMASSTQSIRTLAETYLTTELGEYADHTGILNHIKNY